MAIQKAALVEPLCIEEEDTYRKNGGKKRQKERNDL